MPDLWRSRDASGQGPADPVRVLRGDEMKEVDGRVVHDIGDTLLAEGLEDEILAAIKARLSGQAPDEAVLPLTPVLLCKIAARAVVAAFPDQTSSQHIAKSSNSLVRGISSEIASAIMRRHIKHLKDNMP
jgi:hypothetical protein